MIVLIVVSPSAPGTRFDSTPVILIVICYTDSRMDIWPGGYMNSVPLTLFLIGGARIKKFLPCAVQQTVLCCVTMTEYIAVKSVTGPIAS